jgi:hypothetical protein
LRGQSTLHLARDIDGDLALQVNDAVLDAFVAFGPQVFFGTA